MAISGGRDWMIGGRKVGFEVCAEEDKTNYRRRSLLSWLPGCAKCRPSVWDEVSENEVYCW